MVGGPAEREVVREARAYTTWARALIAIVIECAALLVTPADRLVAASVACVLVGGWLLTTVVVLRRGYAAWVLWGDTAVLATLCLLQPWLEVPSLMRDDCGWVLLCAEAALVTHQWQFPRRPAAVAAVVVATAYCCGALLTDVLNVTAVVLSTAWLLTTAVISRWGRIQLQAASRRADAVSAAHEQARREIDVADARRESEAAHLATLHDTVASTLLMVGLGATGPGTRLREQAERDLAVLDTASPAGPEAGAGTVGGETVAAGAEELAEVIAEAIAIGGIPVGFTRKGLGAVVPVPVAKAFAGAVGEALRNVARHSGAGHATVELDTGQGRVLVRVVDAGAGFAEGTGPGRGIRHSIIDRMARIGGRGSVTSSPAGVRVELDWEPTP